MEMEKIIETYLGQAKVGRKQSYKNLAVFPLLSPYAVPADYLTLDEALTGGLIEVAEVSESGSVPKLKVINKAAKMVLILDGEELVGAKQNRIVNTTILVAAQSTTVIPVSCVEQGRWSYHSPRFFSEKRMMSPGLRAMKSLTLAKVIGFPQKRRQDDTKRRLDCLNADKKGTVFVRGGWLWVDFYYMAQRVREPAGLKDLPGNRQLVRNQLDLVVAEIKNGVFEFAKRFPRSKKGKCFARLEGGTATQSAQSVILGDYVKRWWKELAEV